MKSFKKIIAFLLSLGILMCSFNLTGATVFAEASFASGDGSTENPYIITTPAQLNLIRKGLTGHYKLGADIVFTEEDFAEGGSFYNNGKFWVPVGTSSIPFSGSFDGNGFAISGLKIYNSGKAASLAVSSSGDDEWSGDYIIGGNITPTISPTMGLFGYNSGTIKNVSLQVESLYGKATNSKPMYVGAVAGYNTGTISGCYVFGSVYSASATSPLTYSGMVAGYNKGGTIENCYSGGRITGDYSGGIVGGSESGCITNCYSLSVGVNYKFFGGILGYNKETATTLTNCYYDIVKGLGVGKGTDTVTALTLEQMKNSEVFAGFDFNEVWTMDGEVGYPYPELVKAHAHFSQTLTGISIVSLPTKTVYLKGKEEFEPTGGEIKLTYDTGFEVTIPLAKAEIFGFDKNVLGHQNITVTYGGKTAQLTGIFVIESIDTAYNNSAAIRTGENSSTGKNGLRVYNRISKEFIDRYNIVEYGTIATRKGLITGDFTLDNNDIPKARGVAFDDNKDIIWEDTDTFKVFTAYLTNIPKDKFGEDYVLRVYAKDSNGKYYYGESYSISVFDMAYAIDNGNSLSGSAPTQVDIDAFYAFARDNETGSFSAYDDWLEKNNKTAGNLRNEANN